MNSFIPIPDLQLFTTNAVKPLCASCGTAGLSGTLLQGKGHSPPKGLSYYLPNPAPYILSSCPSEATSLLQAPNYYRLIEVSLQVSGICLVLR